jgi:hypothetical protein
MPRVRITLREGVDFPSQLAECFPHLFFLQAAAAPPVSTRFSSAHFATVMAQIGHRETK